MEGKLSIQTGGIVLPVERDGEEVGRICFHPADISFASRYFALLDSFDQKQEEFMSKAADIDRDKSVNSFGIPNREARGVALLLEVCGYMKSEIDAVFGAGTSEIVFGDACSLSVFQQFFSAISGYVAQARAGLVGEYAVKQE